jgi:tetratricopeptide (TPR) repeat protein
LGNAWRDAGRFEGALEQYHLAGAKASNIGERELEASASRLSSSVYLQLDKRETALQFASYSVGLLRGTAVVSGLVECLEQLGDAYDRPGGSREAANAYIEAALLTKQRGTEDEWRLAGRGMDIFVELRAIDEYLLAIDRLCGEQDDRESDLMLARGDRLVRRIPRILDSVDQRYAIDILGVLFRLIFDGVPAQVAQFLFEHISGQIIERGSSGRPAWRVLFPLMPLLAALPQKGLTLADAVVLGEQLSARISGMHYKPHSDGAPHWNIVLDYRQAVLCTVSALDSEVETAVVCTLIILFLKGFETQVKERIVGTEAISQREVRIIVGSSVSVPSDVAPHVTPDLVDSPFVVTRPTSFQADETIPTIVFFREGITKEWMPGSGKGSSMQGILATALLELVFQCFRGEIELEVLRPKVVNLMRHTVS